MISGILFDMDGVLIDSEAYIAQAAVSFFADLGVKVKEEDFQPFVGAGEDRYIGGVAEKYGLPLDLVQAKDAVYRKYRQLVLGKVGPMPGVSRFIANARNAGMRMAVASSADRTKVEINLKAIGASPDWFDIVLSGSQVKRKKPFPDIYQFAALSLGLSCEDCLVVEDAVNGVQAAKAAGCFCCGVTGTFDAETLARAGADVVVTSLDAFSDFSTRDELNSQLADFASSATGTTVYGAVRIRGRESRFSDGFLLAQAKEAAKKARENAYAPYSGFKVGAAVVSAATGRIYCGCNVENSSFGATICAERNAILNAIAEEGAIGVDLLVVVSDDAPPAPPCAQCLQVLAEFSRAETEIHLVDLAGRDDVYRFDEMLPHPFIFPSVR
ncbi:MAG: cytidine deaminase [Sphaerochaetaceae bacterium]|jgi:cytidine deaminase